MLREIGISIFLACVGLGAGEGFVDTIIHGGGYIWVGYGVIITILPLLITGLVGRYYCKLNYFTLIGVLAGSTTNPPALAYSNDLTSCDAPAVGYATVYPLTMFLRVLTAQLALLTIYSVTRQYALFIIMLYFPHFGDKIGYINQLLRCIASGNNDLRFRTLATQQL